MQTSVCTSYRVTRGLVARVPCTSPRSNVASWYLIFVSRMFVNIDRAKARYTARIGFLTSKSNSGSILFVHVGLECGCDVSRWIAPRVVGTVLLVSQEASRRSISRLQISFHRFQDFRLFLFSGTRDRKMTYFRSKCSILVLCVRNASAFGLNEIIRRFYSGFSNDVVNSKQYKL